MVFDPNRRFLLGGITAGVLLPGLASGQLRFAGFPFTLGVASGDASPDGFVLAAFRGGMVYGVPGRWTNDRRGCLVNDVTPQAWTGRYRVLDAVTRKGLPIRTAAAWAVETGRPGLMRA